MPNVGPVPDVSPGAGPVGNVEGVSMFQKPPEGRRFRTGLLATVILAAAVLGVSCSAQPWSSVPKGSGGFSLHISFPVSGTAASRALASSARLLLPSATTLKVAMVPSDKRFDTLQSSVDISASATTASVTFPSVAVGDWGIDAVASDASGNQLFGGITEITISPSTTGATLYLVPLGAKDFAVTDSSPALIPQSIGAGASFSWTVPAAALYLDKSFDVWLATTGLEEHLQFFDGTTMTSPSQSVGKGAGSYVTVYNPGTSAATANIILDPYRLTYNSNAGTGTTTYVDPIGYMPGGSYADATVLQASDVGFSRTGYSFSTWTTNPNGSGTSCAPDSSLAISAATTLYAQWTANPYTITLNPGTGATVNPTSQSVTFGSAVGTLPTPTLTGSNFVGWFTGPNGTGTQYTSTTIYNQPNGITLYADWTSNAVYTVTFNAQGGSVNPTSQSVIYDTAVGTLPTPTLTGNTFLGWYTGTGGTGTQYTSTTTYTQTSGITLYAAWSVNSYTLSFDPNATGTSGSMSSQSVAYETGLTLPTNAFVNSGYRFLGWGTSAGGPVVYADGASFTMGASNVTLYAQWEALASVNIDFTFSAVDPQALTFSSASVTIASGNHATLQTSNLTLLSSGGSWQWYVDGAQVSGATSPSFTYDPATYGLGQHTVTVKVLYNSLWYSGDLMVTAAQ